ncbi:hypothetical protein Tco_1369574 [Tanacetum coccineum]
MFQAKTSKERLDVVKSLMACKPKPGASICAFILKMKRGIKKLIALFMAPVLTVGHNVKKRKTSQSNWKRKAAIRMFDRGSKRMAEYEIAPTSDPKEVGLKESRRLKHGELNLIMENRKITLVTRIGKTTGRVSKPPQFYYGFHIEEDKISDSTLSELDKPANYKEAMASPDVAKWKESMKSEIQSMYDNQV